MIVAETQRPHMPPRQMSSLQWGRDLIVAETGMSYSGVFKAALLQWGRDLIVAETTAPSSPEATSTRRFNGAAT